jgi:hypothetical protein
LWKKLETTIRPVVNPVQKTVGVSIDLHSNCRKDFSGRSHSILSQAHFQTSCGTFLVWTKFPANDLNRNKFRVEILRLISGDSLTNQLTSAEDQRQRAIALLSSQTSE